MPKIPRDRLPDNTLGLLLDGYEFISNRCEHHQSDLFQTRLMFENTLCFRGVEAAKVFYDTEKFTRHKAAPKRVQKTLFGEGGIQGMDGQAHQHRKQMFMGLMSSERIDALVGLAHKQWRAAAEKWQAQDQIVLFSAAREVLCRAVYEWAGVPLPEEDVKQRTEELASMIDGSAAIGLQHWKGKRARQQAEERLGTLIASVRQDRITPPTDSALSVIARYKQLDSKPLPERIAAVELINVLRPTLAIGRYVTFAALALHEHLDCRQKLLADDDKSYPELFVQEVRRFYPFFPFAAARVKQDFDWQGYHFREGTRVLLDLYGTNHDAQLWSEPESFRPERFRDWREGQFDLIPQGGGDFYLNHRCPGEWITIALMKATVEFLTQTITYQVPEQDLSVKLSKMPALPESQLIISDVRLVG